MVTFGPLLMAPAPLLAHPVAKTLQKVSHILPLDDGNTGFRPIFDGKTLDGWDGDPAYWRAEDGELVGEVTALNLLKRNTFIIWRGGKPKNFELKAEYRGGRPHSSRCSRRRDLHRHWIRSAGHRNAWDP